MEPCPQCEGLMTLSGKRNAKCTVCGFTMPYELPDPEEAAAGTTVRPLVAKVPRSTLSQATGEAITTADLQDDQNDEIVAAEQEEEEEERQAAAV